MSYYTKITKVGLAAIVTAVNENKKLPITYMAFGDGSGYVPEPDEDATALVNEIYRTGLNKIEVHNKNPNWLVCEAIIPSSVGGFNIREVGLYDVTGTKLIAVASYPPTYKPKTEEGAAKIQTIRIILQIDNSGTFELIIDPDIVLATIAYVEENFKDSKVKTWSGRSLEEKNKEIISPQDYKAKGDGVTNDTQSFVDLELNHQNINVDLQGKTYKVDRDFNKNHYHNGSFRVINSNKGKGRFTGSSKLHKFNNGNGQKIGEIVVPLYDEQVETASTIIQSAYYLGAENKIYTQRVLRGSGATEESIIDCFDYAKIPVVGTKPNFTSQPLNFVGHQSIAVTRDIIGAGRRFWATCGATKYSERARYIVQFALSDVGVYSDVKYFKVFGDDFIGNTTPVMSISPNQKFLVATCTHPTKGRYARVFNIETFNADGDYSDKYIYEFGFQFFSDFNPQSVCCDDEFIYILHGGSTGSEKIEVYTLDGSFVALDERFTVGSYDATLFPYYYYEPESLFVGDNGRLMCLIACAKRDGQNARGSYTNIINSIEFYETKNLSTDGDRPLVSMRATRCFSHPSNSPITYSALTSTGYIDYFSQNYNLTKYSRKGSGYALQIMVDGTYQPQLRLQNNLNDGLLQISSGGIFGLFSLKTNKYVCAIDQNNTTLMQHDIKVAGAVLPSSTVGSYKIGGPDNIWADGYIKKFWFSPTIFFTWSNVNPEGVIAGGIGSKVILTSNGDEYIKKSDTGNTGWVKV